MNHAASAAAASHSPQAIPAFRAAAVCTQLVLIALRLFAFACRSDLRLDLAFDPATPVQQLQKPAVVGLMDTAHTFTANLPAAGECKCSTGVSWQQQQQLDVRAIAMRIWQLSSL
jgi:hypothetical protein